ncbi:baseplate J/gp47 family protein [Christensenellaceae bacterium OttesenSCG-928-M15]|nr:baseplate J/gp47 family protein [Christensenellaceae bacterium OttesenSCG-928-M15]
MRTADQILTDMLARVPGDVDKREGSLIFHALGPTSEQLEEVRLYIDNVQDTMMPDTARGEDQDRVNGQQGVNRLQATQAIRQGEFYADEEGTPATVPIGSRFFGGGVNYAITELIEAGKYRLICEQPGVIGNTYFGAILPVDNLDDLAVATLTDVLIPGEDQESDDAYRDRYYKTVNAKPFGGNRAAYELAIIEMAGVGGVKAYRRPLDGVYVTCVICDATMGVASPELIASVQDAVDPVASSGEGIGFAPIGHRVEIKSVTAKTVDIAAAVVPAPGVGLPEAQAEAEEAINTYLQEIAFEQSVVRVARVESILLNLETVIDVMDTTINGVAGNLILDADYVNYEVPELGSITLTEA